MAILAHISFSLWVRPGGSPTHEHVHQTGEMVGAQGRQLAPRLEQSHLYVPCWIWEIMPSRGTDLHIHGSETLWGTIFVDPTQYMLSFQQARAPRAREVQETRIPLGKQMATWPWPPVGLEHAHPPHPTGCHAQDCPAVFTQKPPANTGRSQHPYTGLLSGRK